MINKEETNASILYNGKVRDIKQTMECLIAFYGKGTTLNIAIEDMMEYKGK